MVQGDRVGICVTQFDPKAIERCLVSNPGRLPTIHGQFHDYTQNLLCILTLIR